MATAPKKTSIPRKTTRKTTRKTAPKTAPKTAARKVSTPKPKVAMAKTRPATAAKAPVATPVAATVVAAARPAVGTPTLKRNELYERVVQECGLKRREVKMVSDALLLVLGKALANGEDLQLPPLGKVKVNREKLTGKNRILICKIRQNLEPKPGTTPSVIPAVNSATAAE